MVIRTSRARLVFRVIKFAAVVVTVYFAGWTGSAIWCAAYVCGMAQAVFEEIEEEGADEDDEEEACAPV